MTDASVKTPAAPAAKEPPADAALVSVRLQKGANSLSFEGNAIEIRGGVARVSPAIARRLIDSFGGELQPDLPTPTK